MSEVAALTASFRDEVLNLLLDDGPELTTGLRKLLEAKDCFVRHALVCARAAADTPPFNTFDE